MVRGEGNGQTECLSLLTPYASPLTPDDGFARIGIGLATSGFYACRVEEHGGPMTKGNWLLVGAVVMGLAVGLYILFFCPTDCH